MAFLFGPLIPQSVFSGSDPFPRPSLQIQNGGQGSDPFRRVLCPPTRCYFIHGLTQIFTDYALESQYSLGYCFGNLRKSWSSVDNLIHNVAYNAPANGGTDGRNAYGLVLHSRPTRQRMSVPDGLSIPAGGAADATGLQFTVALTNPTNATIGTGTGTGTINHDTAPADASLTPLPETTQVNTGTTLTSTVTDVATAADIASVELRVGHTSSYATSLNTVYNQTTNL